MKIIKNLSGHPHHAADKVRLVEIDGKKYVLKTEAPEEVASEKFFYKTLLDNNCDSLPVKEFGFLTPDQLLTAYVEGSPTLAQRKNEEAFVKWGEAIGKMHTIKFPACLIMDDSLRPKKMHWEEFIRERIRYGLEKKTDLSENFPKQKRILFSELMAKLPRYSLLHSDLHDSNVLVARGKLFLFDKYGTILSGDHLFDLAIPAIQYPNKLYINSNAPDRQNDVKLLAALKRGYGDDFISRNRKKFDIYVLLRCLIRYPNPFEPHIEEIVGNILRRY